MFHYLRIFKRRGHIQTVPITVSYLQQLKTFQSIHSHALTGTVTLKLMSIIPSQKLQTAH